MNKQTNHSSARTQNSSGEVNPPLDTYQKLLKGCGEIESLGRSKCSEENLCDECALKLKYYLKGLNECDKNRCFVCGDNLKLTDYKCCSKCANNYLVQQEEEFNKKIDELKEEFIDRERGIMKKLTIWDLNDIFEKIFGEEK